MGAGVTESRPLLLLVWTGLGAWTLYLLSPILTPFLFAALLAYLGNPLLGRLEAYHLPRALAVTLVFLALFGLLLLLLLILVPRLEDQVSQLLGRLPRYLEWLKGYLQPYLEQWLPEARETLNTQLLGEALAQHWQTAGGVLAGVWQSLSRSGLALITWLVNLLLVPVLAFYLLRDWNRLISTAATLLPRDSSVPWRRLARESDEVLGAFLRGQLAVMFALGVIYTTGLWLVGLEFALLIGLLAGVVSFVPYLGLIFGIAAAGLASLVQFQGPDQLHWVALVFIVGQVLEGSLLTPRLVGERIGLHPVAVIFAVMAGGQLYGFFGILLALPVAAVAMVFLRYLLESYQANQAGSSP